MKSNSDTLFSKILNTSKIGISNEDINQKNKNLRRIIIFITFLLVSFFFIYHIDDKNQNNNQLHLYQGMVWENLPLIADFTFPIYKNNEDYVNERNKASDNALPVFQFDSLKMTNAIHYVNSICNTLINTPEKIGDFNINSNLYNYLFSLTKQQKDNQIINLKNFLNKFINEKYNFGFVNVATNRLDESAIIIYKGKNQRYYFPTNTLIDKTKYIELAQEEINLKLLKEIQPLASEILNRTNTPNLIFSKEFTDKNMIEAAESIPRTIGIVRSGEIIVRNGEKLTESTIQKIVSYQSSRYITNDNKFSLLFYIINFAQVTIVFIILITYLIILRKKIYNDPKQLIILMILLVLISINSWITANISIKYQIEFLILVPSFAMLVAIIFDSRTAFVMTVTMGLLVAGIHNNNFSLAMTSIFAGTVAAYTVRDIQDRSQIFVSMFIIFIAYLISIFIFSNETSLTADNLLQIIFVAFIGALIAPLITFGLLFLVERFTVFASDLRINEFDRLDHPLLVKLSEIAPGTYQHTLSVSLLAERCAREINANALLTKVGTYYHDIGKMIKPEYFTENQIDMINKHDSLSPKKSARIIIEHVEEGIKLAKQYKLPQRIIDFIPMHHGNSLVKHFYAKALEEMNEDSVDENLFRYPGPKPNSKETAILMICDSAEAISRIESKSVTEIELIIDKNIKDRINDGQFSESDITMHELEIIKKTIAKTLLGITHKRVNYKEIPKEK